MKQIIWILVLILLPFTLVYAQDITFNYQGQDYPIYNVPDEDGTIHQWALIEKGRRSSMFVDPSNPDAGLIEWTGNWRSLSQIFPPSELEPIPTASASELVAIDVQKLDDQLFNHTFIESAVLSPDGSAVAGIEDRSICVYTFSDSQKNCFAFPEEMDSYYRGIYWSPDNETIAFTEDYYRFSSESDIWILDTTTGDFSNLTDDQVNGSLSDNIVEPFNQDYIPTWNPINHDLYFIRSEKLSDEYVFNTSLYRISVETGELHQVTDLNAMISPSTLPWCSINDGGTLGPGLHGVMTISPDGTTLAVLILDYCSAGLKMTANTGVWLIDLTGQNSPRLLVNQSQLQSGMPDYRQDITLVPVGIAWVAGGSGLLVTSSNPQYSALSPANIAYYIDISTANTLPILDFSKGKEDEFNFSRDTVYDVPYGFGVSSDGRKLFMISRIPDMSVLALDLPPDGSIPRRIYTNQDLSYGFNTMFSTVGTDGKMLVQGLLITIH